MNKELNRIALGMIKDRAEGKRVLALGAAMWVDAELLSSLKCESIRTDIIKSEGIDVVCDACSLPFPDESFGFILCRELIEHVPDDDTLLNEIYRVLKPGGWLYITTPNAFNVVPDGIYHLRGYSPISFLQLIERFHFEIVERKGSVPNLQNGLMSLTCLDTRVLKEFKQLAEIFDTWAESYYFGTQLMVLARKL